MASNSNNDSNVTTTSKPAERRQRERDDLRRAILDAARDLFVAQGYEAVTMRKIADAIEYTPTAIYYHFKDKDEILGGLVHEGFSMLAARLNAVEIENPAQRLRAGGEAYLRFAFENPQYYTIMFEMHASAPLKWQFAQDDTPHRAFGFIVRCVAEGVEQGLFRRDLPEEMLTHLVLASCHGAISLLLSGRMKMLPDAMHDDFFALIFDECLESLSVGRAAEKTRVAHSLDAD